MTGPILANRRGVRLKVQLDSVAESYRATLFVLGSLNEAALSESDKVLEIGKRANRKQLQELITQVESAIKDLRISYRVQLKKEEILKLYRDAMSRALDATATVSYRKARIYFVKLHME